MATTISQGTIFNSLKETLDGIITDRGTGADRCSYRKWVNIKSMKDSWVDYLEYGGPGFIAKKVEHAEMGSGTLREGYKMRFTAITYALQLVISREAVQDKKYKEAVMLTQRLKRSAEKTKDMLLTGILVDGWDTTVGIGDGLSLFNTAHTLPDGGTYSNTLAVPLTPSVPAYATVRSACRKLPDHNGTVEGYEPMRVLCPTEQESVWEEILYSTKRPEPGNYAAINVANRDLMGNKNVLIPLRFWDNTTTNWCIQTDEDEMGACLLERIPVSAVSWVDAGQMSLHEGIYTRFDFGVIDGRSFYGSEA